MDLLEKLNSELDKHNTKPCYICGNKVVLFGRGATTILKCSKCGHSARGYILEFCIKSDYDVKKAIGKLVGSWNARN